MLLESDRINIRELEAEDVDFLAEYLSHERTMEFIPWGPVPKDSVKKLVEKSILDQLEENRKSHFLAFVDAGNGQPLGHFSLLLNHYQPARAEFQLVFHPAFHGMGISGEAIQLALLYGFECLGLVRIEAYCHPENSAAARALESAGMFREGNVQEVLKYQGKWTDAYLYGVGRTHFLGS